MTTGACPGFCVLHEGDDETTDAHVGELRMVPLRDTGAAGEARVAAVFAVQRISEDDRPHIVVDIAGVRARLSLREAWDFEAALDEVVLRALGHEIHPLPMPVPPPTWGTRPFATLAAVVRAAVRGRCRRCAARLDRHDCAPPGGVG